MTLLEQLAERVRVARTARLAAHDEWQAAQTVAGAANRSAHSAHLAFCDAQTIENQAVTLLVEAACAPSLHCGCGAQFADVDALGEHCAREGHGMAAAAAERSGQ